MTKGNDLILPLNFDLIRIKEEFWALQDYLRLLENQIPNVIAAQEEYHKEREREIILNNPDEIECDLDISLNDQDNNFIVEEVIPRLFRSPFVVMLWASFEIGMITIARVIQEECNLAVPFDSEYHRKKPFITRVRKYFRDELKFALPISEQDFGELEKLRVLRNAIAHAGGLVQSANSKDRIKIQQWLRIDSGIRSNFDGYLVFSREFLEKNLQFVKNCMYNVIQHIEQTIV